MQPKNTQPIIDNLIPVGFRCLVKIYERPTTTSSGLYIPENEHSGMPTLSVIAALGKKTWVQHLQMFLGLKPRYKIGTWVYFRKYSVDELRITGEDAQELLLYVLEENEIISLVGTV